MTHRQLGPCTVCGRPMRGHGVPAAEMPGTASHGGNGECDACVHRRRRNAPPRRAAPSQRYRAGDLVQLIAFHRTRDGLQHRMAEGAYIRITRTQWVLDTPDGQLALDRDEWAEVAA